MENKKQLKVVSSSSGNAISKKRLDGTNSPIFHTKTPKLVIGEDKKRELTSRIREIMKIQSKSYNQKDMLDFIHKKIYQYGAEAYVDDYGNYYAIKGEAKTYPCIIAHTDTVHKIKPSEQYKVYNLKGKMFAFDHTRVEMTGIGGDDKVGIFCALEALKNNKKIKVAFFKDEEVGCIGSGKANKDFFDDVSFVLQADRKGYNDITNKISGLKMYDDNFENLLKPLLEKYQKNPVNGGLTDVYKLAYSNKIDVCGFNTSCGYYRPHRDNEYIVVDEVILTYMFFQDVINSLWSDGIRYPIKREKPTTPYYNHKTWYPESQWGRKTTHTNKEASKSVNTKNNSKQNQKTIAKNEATSHKRINDKSILVSGFGWVSPELYSKILLQKEIDGRKKIAEKVTKKEYTKATTQWDVIREGKKTENYYHVSCGCSLQYDDTIDMFYCFSCQFYVDDNMASLDR